ncbi:hypothetical protein Pmar_PMAR021058 [Perkinsus marinus ATCC 50983]|uniref:Serine carboxypeptidase n=1 Tax=Perkinsus marinus (strain ATCC 50983 / TXsc) TaxID=423536 RepID=C5KGA4_PERM5|nr:hypothetical protein Pmar_PMAR021058 [Perkinsus marinus ATCC 50983]EER16460.1 hypothetical protein Pmar_PMAR021058 [Perkinsus marinus ATCC 50983]|eukprot:XP_002784664.1 hypothetical protein Pmar_PMAR021058 [Perkinsus marinus ATCC 50983]
MIIALVSAFACIVAITDAGGLGNEDVAPAFHHLRSLNGGGVLCPGSKGKQAFGYTSVLGLNKYFYAVMEAEDVDPTSAPTFLYIAGGPGSNTRGLSKQTAFGSMRLDPPGLAWVRLELMKMSLKMCEKAVDKCNSNGPGKPAKPANCQDALGTCDAITMDPMHRLGKSM